MSCMLCDNCKGLTDTDSDPDSLYVSGFQCLCKGCRNGTGNPSWFEGGRRPMLANIDALIAAAMAARSVIGMLMASCHAPNTRIAEMSIDRCVYCSRPVDTDEDTDCYQPDPRHSLCGHPDICVCEVCRGGADQDEPDWTEPDDTTQFYADREVDSARSNIADYEELIHEQARR